MVSNTLTLFANNGFAVSARSANKPMMSLNTSWNQTTNTFIQQKAKKNGKKRNLHNQTRVSTSVNKYP
jgi:ABC-type sugar transport system substrate-binding protein